MHECMMYDDKVKLYMDIDIPYTNNINKKEEKDNAV